MNYPGKDPRNGGGPRAGAIRACSARNTFLQVFPKEDTGAPVQTEGIRRVHFVEREDLLSDGVELQLQLLQPASQCCQIGRVVVWIRSVILGG